MARIVDELIVTLGLDPAGFTKGQREAAQSLLRTKQEAERAGKGVGKATKDAGQEVSQLRGQLLSLLAVFTGGRGISQFSADLARADTALGRMSERTRTSVSDLGMLKGAAVSLGVSGESVTGSIDGLHKALVGLRYTGDSPLLPYLRALQLEAPGVNLSLVDNNGETLRGIELVEKLRQAFRGLPKDRANYLGQNLGLSEDTVYLLTRTDAEFRKMIADQKRWGVSTKEQIELDQKWIYSNTGVSRSFDTLGRAVLEGAQPGLIRFNELITDGLVWLQKHPDTLKEVAVGFGLIGAAIAGITLAPFITTLATVAATVAAIVASVKFLQEWKSATDKGWVPGTPVTASPMDRFKERQAMFGHDPQNPGRLRQWMTDKGLPDPDKDYFMKKYGRIPSAQELRWNEEDRSAPGQKYTPKDNSYDIERAKRAISEGIESGGNYGAIGPDVKRGDGSVDRAYGKYQVMGANLPSWTKGATGRSMSPQEFLADKDAQEKVFEKYFGDEMKKRGFADAASVWFSGQPLAQAQANKIGPDVLGTTVPGYVKTVVDKYNSLPPTPGTTAQAQKPVTVTPNQQITTVPLPAPGEEQVGQQSQAAGQRRSGRRPHHSLLDGQGTGAPGAALTSNVNNKTVTVTQTANVEVKVDATGGRLDPFAIARDLKAQLDRQLFTGQAEYGVR